MATIPQRNFGVLFSEWHSISECPYNGNVSRTNVLDDSLKDSQLFIANNGDSLANPIGFHGQNFYENANLKKFRNPLLISLGGIFYTLF